MNYTPYKQRGITGVAFAALIALLLFFVWIAILLFPIYMENFKVSSHLHKIAKDEKIDVSNPDGIKQSLLRRFDIDDVKHVSAEDITITQNLDSVLVTIDYEVRANVFGNIDLVVSFVEEETVKTL